MKIYGKEVLGTDVDANTRCAHYHGPLDVIAIRFKCCGGWYPCYDCHTTAADHPAKVWPRDEFDEQAIFCGQCGTTLAIGDYLTSNSECPACGSGFNPGCRNHYHLYFER